MLKHIAFIMDGNGRWAKKQNRERTYGHKVGAERIKDLAIEANKMGIEVMTLYAFSTENWKRPPKEVEYLCKLPQLFFDRYLAKLQENDIKVSYIGELEAFPEKTQKIIKEACEQTKDNKGLNLVIAINYGGQREIVLAAKKYAEAIASGDETSWNEENFNKYLMTSELPPVDLMVRTSGEKRLSNFLLWQLAYAEFIFVDEPWPEFNEKMLHQVVDEYNKRHRRFGGVEDA